MSHETRTKPPTYPEILDIHDGAFSESIWGSDGFRTIKVTGQDDVIADSYKDDLTIAAGTNVILTTSASGDSLTIASTPYTAGTGIQLSGTEFSITALAITSVHSVANETAHLALTTQEGDVVVRTDENKSYIRNTGTAGNMTDFTLLQTPTDLVLSVAGNVGHITNNQIRDAVEAATDSNTFTDADHSKLNAIEASATADQTSTEIKALLASDKLTVTHIADGAITSVKIGAGEVNDTKLSSNSVTEAKIVDANVTAAKLDSNAVITTKIADDAVTYAKMQNVSATNKVLGRDSSGAGVVEEISPADLRTMINVEDGADVTDATNVNAAGAVMNADVDAKGDILAASTDNTVTRLAVGTNNHLLTADSSEATGLKWRAENAHSDKVNQDAFSIVAVSGQDNVVADAAQDTLTFAAGTNVTVTTNATSDTVTIAAADTSKMPLAGGTFTGDVTINDGEELGFGSQNDLVIVHDGTDGLIKETTGNLDIRAKNTNGGIITISDSAGENLIKATAGSSVVLTYDGTDRVTTTNAGVTVAGTLIADLDINTSTISDLQATITDSDAKIPTSGAVVDYVASQLGPIGGLEVIADDESFPDTVPGVGVVISIADAAGLSVNSSGVSTNGDTLNNSTVTINGFPTELRGGATVGNQTNADPYVFGAGAGLMVQSTGSNHTYNYHQALIRESDFVRLSSDLDDFQERYRIASSAPSSNNDDGDLYFDTSSKRMKVYNGATSEWDDVAQSSESHIVTLSESFNGSLTDFTMSTAATDAQSTIVSINGVIQKPNAGTSTPSEGFAISGNTLKLSNAPATGSDYFVVVLGDTVSIGTPSDDTVTGAKIVDNAVGAEHIEVLDAALQFVDSAKAQFGTDNDLEIYHTGNHGYIDCDTGNLLIRANVAADVGGNIYLRPHDDEHGIQIIHDDAVELFFDGGSTPTLQTTASGVKVDGADPTIHITSSTGTNNSSSAGIKFAIAGGSSGDYSKAGLFVQRQSAYTDLDMIFAFRSTADTDSVVVGDEKARITSGGSLKLPDNGKIELGGVQTGSGDLQIYHDGSHSYIKDTGTGHLLINTSELGVMNAAGNEDMIKATEEGGVELYNDNSKKFFTHSAGCQIDGNLSMTLADGYEIRLGQSNDLKLYHNGNDAKVINTTGRIDIETGTGNIALLGKSGTEHMAKFIPDGAVELYEDGEKRFETTGTGILATGPDSGAQLTITGIGTNAYGLINFDGPGTGGGNIKIEGEHAIQLIKDGGVRLYCDGSPKMETYTYGIFTEGHVWCSRDDDRLIVGADSDLQIYHDGNNTIIHENGTGDLKILASDFQIKNSADNELYMSAADTNGEVKLYYLNLPKLTTTSSGIKITSGNAGVAGIMIEAPEGQDAYIQWECDDGDDHPDFYRWNNKASDNTFSCENYGDSAWEQNIVCNHGGSVDLYYDNVKRFETLNYGARVTGQFLMDADLAGYAGLFVNDGNSTDRYGLYIKCGTDDSSGTNYPLWFADGNGTDQGGFTFNNGTVALVAFTAAHPAEVPNSDNPSDNSPAYPYGTLVETTDITYSKKADGSDSERGIIYKIQKTQSANSRKILGVYSGNMRGGPAGRTNDHEVSVLGDGHILCNNAGGNIEVGDGICSSSAAGIGQKATVNPSMIIGIAQEAITFTGSETKLVAVQYGLQQFTPWT